MFTTVEIAEVTGGKLLGGSVTVTGVSTDTRTIAPGMLFVAIRGESFDGNDYIGAAAEKGAAAAISDRSSGADGYSIPVILVEDSRAAQLALARYHRERFPLKLVGVTGSVGKTSTKDMVYAVLSAKYTTLKTEGNFNNDIGLPRTLFRLNESYGAAVIEMGMSGLGEISVLSKAAAPDICIKLKDTRKYPEGKARDTRRRFCGGSADTQRRRRVSENRGYSGQEDSPVRQGR